MSERVRDNGDGLILAFPTQKTTVEGEELQTTRLYFFRVGSHTRYFQRYTALSSINSGNSTPGGGGFDFLGDTGVGSGSDIFRVETDDWHAMHFGVGLEHPDLHVWHAVSPNSNGNPGQDRTGTDEDIDTTTDDRGWYSSKQIEDRYDPPAFTERVSFRNSSNRTGEFLQWAFHNDGAGTLSGSDLDLLFTGRSYKLQPVTSQETQREMLEMALRQPDNPTIDTVMHQVGGVNNYRLGSEEPDSWGDIPEMRMTVNVQELTSGPSAAPTRGR
jgi:hypothetical protein